MGVGVFMSFFVLRMEPDDSFLNFIPKNNFARDFVVTSLEYQVLDSIYFPKVEVTMNALDYEDPTVQEQIIQFQTSSANLRYNSDNIDSWLSSFLQFASTTQPYNQSLDSNGYWIGGKTSFYDALNIFLNSTTQGDSFYKDVLFVDGGNNRELSNSKISFFHKNVDHSIVNRVEAMDGFQSLCSSYKTSSSIQIPFPHAREYLWYEAFKDIQGWVVEIIGLQFVGLWFVSIVMFGDLFVSFLLPLLTTLSHILVLSFFYLQGELITKGNIDIVISTGLSPITATVLILGGLVGITFNIFIIQSYLLQDFQLQNKDRMHDSIMERGTPIFVVSIASVIPILPLLISSSPTLIYLAMALLITLIASNLISLLLLPTILPIITTLSLRLTSTKVLLDYINFISFVFIYLIGSER